MFMFTKVTKKNDTTKSFLKNSADLQLFATLVRLIVKINKSKH